MEGGALDREFLEFLNGNKNAAKTEVLFLKDEMPNKMQRITIKIDDKPIYEFWVNPKKPRGNKEPGSTGGKKPYIMLMLDEMKKLRDADIKNPVELVGCLAYLAEFVEWGTGRLIKRRAKKPLRYGDLLEILPYGNKKINQILSDLKKYDFLVNNLDGYFISDRLIKKGKKKKQGGN
jgi:hypothetical protein